MTRTSLLAHYCTKHVKLSVRVTFLLVLLFWSNYLDAQPTEEERKSYATAIQNAFELQSKGYTRQAFYVFKNAYQTALKSGESPAKLRPLEELFVWYRTYGYDSGIMEEPSNCLDEYRSTNGYEKSRELDPHQQKMIRGFLYGVGSTIGGIFCVTISTPISGKVGYSLITAGIKCMYDAINAMIEDYQEKKKRNAELDRIFKKLKAERPSLRVKGDSSFP